MNFKKQKNMKTSISGLEMIKKHEGFRAKPYLCPANVPTIGYGATYYLNGTNVSMTDGSISKSQATDLLKKMVERYEQGVERYLQVEVNQNQFDALVSFAYNLGLGAFKSSTLLKKINVDPCDPDIAYQFKRWVRANGIKLEGLVRRRDEEAKLYFKNL
jgi:lysozyme